MSRNTHYNAALKACAHARAHIPKGFTHIEMNDYDEARQVSVIKGVKDIRDRIDFTAIPLLRLDPIVSTFIAYTEVTRKFSVGNCVEMAVMALEFIFDNEPQISAEVYEVEGGDHSILIIGRDQGSNPRNPDTWNSETIICDPLSDDVYAAEEYATRLQTYNFSIRQGLAFNEYQLLNRYLHRLSPKQGLNTQYIRSFNTKEHYDELVDSFFHSIKTIKSALKTWKDSLESTKERLFEKYGASGKKLAIINRKIIEVDKILAMRFNLPQTKLPPDNYRQTGAYLNLVLREFRRRVELATDFSIEETLSMYEYKDQDSILTRLVQFFHIPPKTIRDTKPPAELPQPYDF